jgi:hypothetical protein
MMKIKKKKKKGKMVFIIQFKWVKTVGGIQIELGRKEEFSI